MPSLNRKTLVREAATYANYGTGGLANVALMSIDLSNYKGYNYGNSGNTAKGTLKVTIAGVRGSSGTRQHGEWLVFLNRDANASPTFNAYAHPNNDAAGVTLDVSGNLFRVMLNVLGTTGNPTIIIGEITGPILDFTP